MSQRFQITLAAELESLQIFRDFITECCARYDISHDTVLDLKLAVDEACTNIIQHAYGGEGRGQIQLLCETQAEGLRVTIYDQGRSFEPLQVPDLDPQAPLPKRQPGGMGPFFIRNLMDTVEFKFGTPQGNQLILFKRRESTS